MSWKDFERLTAQIYAELEPTATVTHDDHIVGLDSNLPRQIDVSIHSTVAGHEILIAIQAKDHADPADINDVGAFATVLRDIRANKGILICRGGFTSGAQALAANLGIDLCNVHDAETRTWRLDISLPVLWVDLHPSVRFDMAVQLEAGDSIPPELMQWVISPDGGRTQVDLSSTFVRAWNEGRLPQTVGPVHKEISSTAGHELLVETADRAAAWRPIHQMGFSYTVSQKAWLGSFTPDQCRGILNYRNGVFETSYMPMGAVPTERDASWRVVENPDELAVSIPGTVVTTIGWELDPNSAAFGEVSMNLIDTLEDGP